MLPHNFCHRDPEMKGCVHLCDSNKPVKKQLKVQNYETHRGNGKAIIPSELQKYFLSFSGLWQVQFHSHSLLLSWWNISICPTNLAQDFSCIRVDVVYKDSNHSSPAASTVLLGTVCVARIQKHAAITWLTRDFVSSSIDLIVPAPIVIIPAHATYSHYRA